MQRPEFQVNMNPLGMFRVNARAAIKIPEIERGRVFEFVNCLECGHNMLFKLELEVWVSLLI